MTELVTIQSIIERRNRGDLTLAEFVEAVNEFAQEMGDADLAAAVKAFDLTYETDKDTAEENFEDEVARIAEGLVGPESLLIDFSDAYPNAISSSQLAALTEATKKDFRPGMTYYRTRRIGQVNTGTDTAPVWEPRFELLAHTVNPNMVSQEFKEFKWALRQGQGAYNPVRIAKWDLSVTTPSANYVATLQILNPLSLIIDWGDGRTDTITSGTAATHTYVAAGSYVIKLSGYLGAGGKISCEPLGTVLKATSVIESEQSDFSRVFLGTGLTAIPTGLFDKCVKATAFGAFSPNGGTFQACTSLTGSIPAGLFDKNPLVTNFGYLFSGCTGLTGAIPTGLFDNNVLAENFRYAFNNSGLTGAIPAGLFAKNILANDFSSTFRDNIGITGAIPGNLFTNCPLATNFGSTFQGSSGLTGAIPAGLFANCTLAVVFASTFNGSSGLTGAIPAGLFANCTLATTFNNTFASCSGLTAIPANLFKFNTLANNFAGTFQQCGNLAGAIPAGLFDFNTLATTFVSIFFNCVKLTSIPANLFLYCPLVTTFTNVFRGCTGLTAIPTLFTNNPACTDYSSVFNGCSNIVSAIPATIFQNSPLVTTFSSAFNVCTKITGAAPALWVTYPAALGTSCFRNATLLTNYAAIPAAWK